MSRLLIWLVLVLVAWWWIRRHFSPPRPPVRDKSQAGRKQAIAHEDTDPQAQDARNEWHNYDDPALKNISKRDRVGDSARSGSDSNSDR